MNQLMVHLDDASELTDNPGEAEFAEWAMVLGKCLQANSSICLKLVSELEMAQLNQQFRGKQGTTNVLSFPVEPFDASEFDPEQNDLFLGDIAICAEVVNRESRQQHKEKRAHWTHIFFHGALHLLGFDHQNDHDAEIMEKLETELLAELQIAAPYHEGAQRSAS